MNLSNVLFRAVARALPAAVLCCVALGALPARAQITIKNNGGAVTPPILVGFAACDGDNSLSLSWDLGTASAQSVTAVATQTQPTANATCPAGSAVNISANQQGSASVKVKSFLSPSAAGDGGTANGCSTTATSAIPFKAFFCISYTTSGLISGSSTVSASVEVDFALQPPGAPTALAAVPGDAHVKLSWSPANSSDNISSYDVYAVPAGQAIDPNQHVETASGVTSADVQNTDDGAALVNDVAYDFAVRANDLYGNTSPISQPFTATAIQIDDFYNTYRNRGGSAAGGGGCTSGGGAGLLAGLALGLLALRARRRRAASGAVLLALLCAAGPSRAELPLSRSLPDEPRRLLLALKIDRYDPQIDTEAGLSGRPYHEIFHGRAPLRWQLEGDWEVAHPFGTLLLGGTIGFWENIGKGLVHSSQKPSDDTALLDVLPLSLIATYRFDWVADRVRWLPFIPYAQAGLSTALWVSKAGNGKVSTRNAPGGTGRGSGWSYGYTTAVGFALALDALNPDVAKEARAEIGLKRSTLFAEYGWTRLDDFRKGGTLILSDRAWRFGFALEF